MKQLFIIGLLGTTLASCGGKDSICDCIAVGDQLNKKSNKALQHIPSKAEIVEIKRLQKEKAAKCKEFQTMSGKEMLERKETCD